MCFAATQINSYMLPAMAYTLSHRSSCFNKYSLPRQRSYELAARLMHWLASRAIGCCDVYVSKWELAYEALQQQDPVFSSTGNLPEKRSLYNRGSGKRHFYYGETPCCLICCCSPLLVVQGCGPAWTVQEYCSHPCTALDVVGTIRSFLRFALHSIFGIRWEPIT